MEVLHSLKKISAKGDDCLLKFEIEWKTVLYYTDGSSQEKSLFTNPFRILQKGNYRTCIFYLSSVALRTGGFSCRNFTRTLTVRTAT